MVGYVGTLIFIGLRTVTFMILERLLFFRLQWRDANSDKDNESMVGNAFIKFDLCA